MRHAPLPWDMHRSAAGVEKQEGLRTEHLRLGGAADVRIAEVVPLVETLVGVEVGVSHVGRVVPAWSGSGLGSRLGLGSGLGLGSESGLGLGFRVGLG